MEKLTEKDRLITHTVSSESVESAMKKIAERIKKEGDKPYVTVQRQLEMLEQASQFDFGRFLIQNQGINGYWTHYMLTHPWFGKKTGKNNRGEPFTEMESFILNRAPILLATQQRFEIFLRENQKHVKNDAKLACIPSGMLGELLYLDFKNIDNIELIGIDYDPDTLVDAKSLAEHRHLTKFVKLIQGDAWHLNVENEFDLISSNGLNIYESDDAKVTELYRQFHKALKPNGTLVTSFLTIAITSPEQCEWDMSKINKEDLLLQKIFLGDIIGARWQQCYRSKETTQEQLESVGFKDIKLQFDEAKIFPTVIATKA